MAQSPVYISSEKVRELVSMADVIDAVEDGLAAFSAQKVVQPVRSYMKPANPRVLCIVGSGVQARGHAEALQVVCQFEEIRIWGRDIDRLKHCASDIGGTNTKIFQDLQTACKDADVIVTVTIATEPILKGEWLKDGAVVLGELEYYNNLK
ncbi:ketimine reductase mu-crystallin-like [Gigantopelta aegis]|uniref:ketimine reductase mu-crystallin-like n=1 Tax=Gigantopelta aegis TaxID=1735272 RepID=UPI001B8898A1|nr:ketimine reductase mu-crystallin-like [Gigantopelta aegis]